MSGIRTTTGLISGIDIGGLVDALVKAERAPAARMESRLANLQASQAGLGQLQAKLLTLTTNAQTLADRKTFSSLTVQNSGSDQFSIATKTASLAGNYQLQTVRLASSQRSVSRGFTSPDTQQIGTAGSIVLSREGGLARPVRLELLNGAQGVRRGTIRLTDRSGATADVNLQNALTTDDVVTAINQSGLGISARTSGGRLVLEDTTGLTASNLSVSDLGGGQTALDLGLRQSVASSTLTGTDVFQVTEDFTYALLNDGNGLRNLTGVPEFSIALQDGTSLAIDLDGTATVGDVLKKINNHESNGGKVVAALQDGRLTLTDTTSGSGTLAVTGLNSSNAVDILGLKGVTQSGGVITSQKLAAGANSVLLRNLRGGQGIETLGSLALTDRTGATATVDLSQAETLDDVLNAINTATTSGNDRLKLTARLNAAGTGIEVADTSGSTSGPLVIEDVGGSTIAADLGIAVNSAVTSVSSGPLRLRTVNESTSLSTYSPKGGAVATGSFKITDSAGGQAILNLTAGARNLGDVIDLINSAPDVQVTARLNDTGDGIVLIDDAAGGGTLKVEEVGGRTAADLRLLGSGTAGSGGQQEINSRKAQVLTIAATDTLNDVMSKINSVGGTLRATIVNSGAVVNSYRLSISSTISGNAGSFFIEDATVGLNFAQQEQGTNAVLRIGSDAATAFMVTSNTNTFTNAVGNLDVTVTAAGTRSASVLATQNVDGISKAIQDFATAYNSYVDLAATLTKFDTATNARAALQGNPIPLSIQTKMNGLFNSVVGNSGGSVRTLADIGLKLTTGGKLSFDSDKLTTALANAPDQVTTLFTDLNVGFGTKLQKTLTGYTDQYDGSLTVQNNVMQSNIDELTTRISDFDVRLALRRVRLENQFTQMETALSGLQSQQTAVTNLASILTQMKTSGS